MDNRRSCPATLESLACYPSSTSAELPEQIASRENFDEGRRTPENEQFQISWDFLAPLNTDSSLDLSLPFLPGPPTFSHGTDHDNHTFFDSRESSIDSIFTIYSGLESGADTNLRQARRVIGGKRIGSRGQKCSQAPSKYVLEGSGSSSRGEYHEQERQSIHRMSFHPKFKDHLTYEVLCSTPQQSSSDSNAALKPRPCLSFNPGQQSPSLSQPVTDRLGTYSTTKTLSTTAIHGRLLQELLRRSPTEQEQDALARLLGTKGCETHTKDDPSLQRNRTTFGEMIVCERSSRLSGDGYFAYRDVSSTGPPSPVGGGTNNNIDEMLHSTNDLDEYHVLCREITGLPVTSYSLSFRRHLSPESLDR